MSRLVISPGQLKTIELHARSTFPEECCGVLIGVPLEDEEGAVVERVLAARNERPDRREERYVVAPETVLAAQKQARTLGLEIVGYYHSHPGGSAAPSTFDLETAWPKTSYVIVALGEEGATEVRSWRLEREGGELREETLDRAEAKPAERRRGRR